MLLHLVRSSVFQINSDALFFVYSCHLVSQSRYCSFNLLLLLFFIWVFQCLTMFSNFFLSSHDVQRIMTDILVLATPWSSATSLRMSSSVLAIQGMCSHSSTKSTSLLVTVLTSFRALPKSHSQTVILALSWLVMRRTMFCQGKDHMNCKKLEAPSDWCSSKYVSATFSLTLILGCLDSLTS